MLGVGVPYESSGLCTHVPKFVLLLTHMGKEFQIWTSRKHAIRNDNCPVDLIIDCSGYSGSSMNKIVSCPDLPELEKIFVPQGAIIAHFDWPDHRSIKISLSQWKELLDLCHARDIRKILFCCLGAHGRTGTAMATFLVAAGVAPKEAIELVRKHHCSKAIESRDQVEYILTACGSVDVDDAVIEQYDTNSFYRSAATPLFPYVPQDSTKLLPKKTINGSDIRRYLLKRGYDCRYQMGRSWHWKDRQGEEREEIFIPPYPTELECQEIIKTIAKLEDASIDLLKEEI